MGYRLVRLLIDTHVLIWFAQDSEELSENAFQLLKNRDNEILLSIASIWEMQIKSQLGKLRLNIPLPELIEKQKAINNLQLLNIELEHIWELENLPHHHRDPFDRILIAQATTLNLSLISIDSAFDNYLIQRLW